MYQLRANCANELVSAFCVHERKNNIDAISFGPLCNTKYYLPSKRSGAAHL